MATPLPTYLDLSDGQAYSQPGSGTTPYGSWNGTSLNIVIPASGALLINGAPLSASVTFPLASATDQSLQPSGVANNALLLHNNPGAVNGLKITGTATSVTPILSAAGGDTNIGIVITTKGTSPVTIPGSGGLTVVGYVVGPILDQGGAEYNALAYGVKWDGSTDDAAALNALSAAVAAAGGGTIKLPFGLGIVGATILFRSHVRFCGAGEHQTTVQLKAATNLNVFDYGTGSLTGVEICDLTVDGNKANQSSLCHGIVFTIFNHSACRRVTVQNTYGRGIFHYQGNDNAITDCTVLNSGKTATTDTTGAGIEGQSVVRLAIKGNRVLNSNDAGISCGGSYCEISANIISTCNFIGIAVSGSTYTTITGNNVSGCSDNGIDTGTATQIDVSGNTINGCLGGIVADMSSLGATLAASLVFSGNQISTMVSSGIVVLGAPHGLGATLITIVGNTIDTVQQHGILVSNVGYSAITGNTIHNAARQGGGWGGVTIAGDVVGCIGNGVTNNRVYEDTAFNTYGIISSGSGNDYNTYSGNDVHTCSNGYASFVGTPGPHDHLFGNIGGVNANLINNLGHGVPQPAIASSTTPVTNTTGWDCTVFVNGGTVSAVAIGTVATGEAVTGGTYRVPAGQSITLTYSVAPTWQWFGD